MSGNQTRFCSLRCTQQHNNFKYQNYRCQKTRAFKRKLELVSLLGGECMVCGYKKNLAALDFHHRDPREKDFKIDARRMANARWESILAEVKKCDLLCANCHREHHCPDMVLQPGLEPGTPGL